tara:strand:- start:1981 stop:2796 length:816 start_codon:yes stop_codon:yes gene_type:complete
MVDKMEKKILVCYLITKFDEKNSLKNFLKKYQEMQSGINHELLICYKFLNQKEITIIRNILKDLNFIEYIDQHIINDFDIGSYGRISKNFPSRLIFFLNGNSFPNCHNWLKIIADNYEENSIIGTSASNLSLYSSLKLKKFYKFFTYFFRLYKYKKKFDKFPNPHLRTNGFLINSDDFNHYMIDKNINNKEDSWAIESGKKSLTNFFKNKKFNIYVVNSKGNKFSEIDWKLSETFNYHKQDKYIISDNQIRKYLDLDDVKKKISQLETWGN